MIFNEEDKKKLDDACSFHICKVKFNRTIAHCHNQGVTTCELCVEDPDVIVWDHCHIMGHFHGAAHHKCNLNYRIVEATCILPQFTWI